MSARDACAVLRHITVSRRIHVPTALHFGVLVLLAYHINRDQGGYAWPSKKRLAGFLGVSPRQIQRILRDLEASSLVERQPPRRPGGTHRFRIQIPEDLHVSP